MKEIWEIAASKGWHDKPISKEQYLGLIVTEAAEAVEEVAKEEAAVVEAAEEKAIDAGEAAAAAAVTASAAGKEAAKEAVKEADAAAKAAKKAEEQAAKEAAKKQAAADKEAEKAKAAKEKADARLEKKRQKRAAQQALIDACPPQYRPVSTSKYFWLAFLSAIPFVGFIATIFLSIAGRNRNVKNFEKAILAYYIIAIVIALIALIVIGVALPAEIRSNVLNSLREIAGSVNIV
jgi:cobalamin biosynthesis Mg chelatase CobN